MTPQDYIKTLPARPYCTAAVGRRLLIRDAKAACSFPIIQHNSPLLWRWMVFDIDGEDGYERAEDRHCPPPTFIALNRQNGHAHIGYLLETPVSAFEASSRRAIEFYADIERGLTNRLGADIAYPGFLSKCPVSEAWLVDWQAKIPYDLGTLNDCLDKRDKRKVDRKEASGIGRNFTLFNALRTTAYAEWYRHVSARRSLADFEELLTRTGVVMNQSFTPALSRPEIKAITKSVAKWVWRKFTMEDFSRIQSARGKRAWSTKETISAGKPWEAEGISRRTWYRRRGTKTISG